MEEMVRTNVPYVSSLILYFSHTRPILTVGRESISENYIHQLFLGPIEQKWRLLRTWTWFVCTAMPLSSTASRCSVSKLQRPILPTRPSSEMKRRASMYWGLSYCCQLQLVFLAIRCGKHCSQIASGIAVSLFSPAAVFGISLKYWIGRLLQTLSSDGKHSTL